MDDLKKQLNEVINQDTNNSVTEHFKKLSIFIDGVLSQSYQVSGDEVTKFLVSNLLNIRDYMSSAVVIESTRVDMENKLNTVIDNYFNPQVEFKKKEKSLEAMQQKPEILSESDRSTSWKKDIKKS